MNSTDHTIENTINGAVRKLISEGYNTIEIKAAIDRIQADITAETASRVYGQAR